MSSFYHCTKKSMSTETSNYIMKQLRFFRQQSKIYFWTWTPPVRSLHLRPLPRHSGQHFLWPKTTSLSQILSLTDLQPFCRFRLCFAQQNCLYWYGWSCVRKVTENRCKITVLADELTNVGTKRQLLCFWRLVLMEIWSPLPFHWTWLSWIVCVLLILKNSLWVDCSRMDSPPSYCRKSSLDFAVMEPA